MAERKAYFKHPSRPGDCQVCDGIGINVLMLPIPLTAEDARPYKPRPVPTRCRWCNGTGYQCRPYPFATTAGSRGPFVSNTSPTVGFTDHNPPPLNRGLAKLLGGTQ